MRFGPLADLFIFALNDKDLFKFASIHLEIWKNHGASMVDFVGQSSHPTSHGLLVLSQVFDAHLEHISHANFKVRFEDSGRITLFVTLVFSIMMNNT